MQNRPNDGKPGNPEVAGADTGSAASSAPAGDPGQSGPQHGLRGRAGEQGLGGSATQPPAAATRYVETTQGRLSYGQLAPLLAERVASVEARIADAAYAGELLDEFLIQKLHGDMAANLIPGIGGRWRRKDVIVGQHEPPSHIRVPELMREYARDLNARIASCASDYERLLETLAFAEGRLLSIHPFEDFNGRATRVFLADLLRRLNLPAIDPTPDPGPPTRRYLAALAQADRFNWKPLMEIWRERFDAREYFEEAFKTLTGHAPMRWQTRLFLHHFVVGELPSAVSIPTGLGKTAVMAIWLIALAWQMRAGAALTLPRRLAYVVDRRAVVDQATTFADELRKNLQKPEATELRRALRLNGESLPISTLRGQFADNREWLQDPSRPAIIVGTVDMIGSRLLFEGYGVSRKMRPYHAGLLGADALALLDEAHLVPPFEALLADIAEDADHRYGSNDAGLAALVPKFRLLPLSATGRRQTAQPFALEADDFDEVREPVAHQRLYARKRLVLHEAGGTKLEETLAERAWALAKAESGELKPVRVIVYCNSREVAKSVGDTLDKKAKDTPAAGRTELFVGARRVKERADAEDRLKTLGFLAGNDEERALPSFLVATSAGEVGVDLDADHMVCDLVAWERMVQRFGRVNRRGGEGRQAEIVVVHAPPKEPETKKPDDLKLEELKEPAEIVKPKALGKKASDEARKAYEEAKANHVTFKEAAKDYDKKKKERETKQQEYTEALAAYEKDWAETFLYRKRLSLLEKLQSDASPNALRNLAGNTELKTLIEECSSPAPLRPALNRALVDAWAMTSLPEHTGRPEIAPWLRGWVDELPQTTVVWRKYLPVRDKDQVQPRKKEIENFFEAAPVHASETLDTESFRVFNWLKKRCAKLNNIADDEKTLKSGDVIAMLLKMDGSLSRALKLGDLLGDTKNKNDKHRLDDIERDIIGKTLVMDARFGGLKDGMLREDEGGTPTSADHIANDGRPWIPAVDDKPVIRFRILEQGNDNDETAAKEWRENLRFDVKRTDGEAVRWLSIQKWRDTSNNEDDRAEGRPQSLVEHQYWTAKRALRLARCLGLPKSYRRMLAIAARLHDEGKRAQRWQRAFRAERHANQFGKEPLAKTLGPINQAVLDGYRHEFGSLPYAKDDAAFQKLPPEQQDLTLHLIAAHHGNARPLIATSGCDDLPPAALDERARDVALRFARQQKRWGPWGLAWWEALLRAADVQASRANDEREDA